MESFESDLFENDELQNRELDAVLDHWHAPRVPARLRRRVFPDEAWWRRVWRISIRIPLPIAVAVAIAVALGAWWSNSREVLKAESFDARAIPDREFAKTVDSTPHPESQVPLQPALLPDKELHPRVISAASDRNPTDQK